MCASNLSSCARSRWSCLSFLFSSIGLIPSFIFFFASYLFSLASFNEISGQTPIDKIFCLPSNQYYNCQYLEPLGYTLKYMPSPSVSLYCLSLGFACLIDSSVSWFVGFMEVFQDRKMVFFLIYHQNIIIYHQFYHQKTKEARE